MASKKVFVGNLSFSLSNGDLEGIFREFGEVVTAKVITDKYTGRSRGFGFVEMENEDSAQKAIDALNGKELNGRNINVNFAREQEPRGNQDSFSGGGGRGGGGGGGRRRREFDNY